MAVNDYTTERLSVESWTPHLGDKVRRAGLETALSTFLTPKVLTHLPESLQRSPNDSVEDWVDARDAEGHMKLVLTKTDAELVGLLYLAEFDDTSPRVHIGYLFAETAWGQGLATELIAGLIQTVTRPVVILAGVEPGNIASARVLEKSGFSKSENGALFSLTLD